MQAEFGEVGHGPCNTYQFGGDVDIAYCFECKKWPSEAYEFIHRSRPYGWPRESLLDKIICRGCHLVPIGDKDNDLSYIQWRLSFSTAEKDLVHSFTHTQLKVYGALKIFLKQVINQIKPVEDLLCSYFLKTVLFYSIESTPASFWMEDMFILCFWFCVNKLCKYIEDGYLPNYFVPQNNMFRSKITGTNQRNLLLVFNQIKRIGWPCLYLCKNFSSLQTFVRFPRSILGSSFILSSSEQEMMFDSIMTELADNVNCTSTQMMKDFFSRASTLVQYARSKREKGMSILLLNSTLGSIGQFIFCSEFSFNNKDRHHLLRKCERYLFASVETGISSGRLNLATFHYKTEQYNKCIQNCWCVLARLKPFLLYKSEKAMGIFNSNKYQQNVCGRDLPVLLKARTTWAADVFVYPRFQTFYPSDLYYDIEANSPFVLYIPPLPYTYFLLFLCHNQLGNIDDSLAALRCLQLLISDELQGSRHFPIVLNFLAICLNKIGDTSGAIEACQLSQRIKPNRNGASKILDKVLCGNV